MQHSTSTEIAAFATIGPVHLRLRGSVRDYEVGPVPAGGYPVIGPDGEVLGVVALDAGRRTVLRATPDGFEILSTTP